MPQFAGTLSAPSGSRVAIIASRFNELIVERLIDGARDTLVRHGVAESDIDLIWVPGAWELPLIVQRVANAKKHGSIVALGCVIRGATPHFDHVAGQANSGLLRAMLESGLPIVNGVLTTDSIEQAIERAGTKAGNKGREAAEAAIELMSLEAKLGEAGIE